VGGEAGSRASYRHAGAKPERDGIEYPGLDLPRGQGKPERDAEPRKAKPAPAPFARLRQAESLKGAMPQKAQRTNPAPMLNPATKGAAREQS